MSERHLYTNRLIHEKSPYLLQHAHNPVDWYPWGRRSLSRLQWKMISQFFFRLVMPLAIGAM